MESIAGHRLPGPALAPCGLATMVVLGQYAAVSDPTAELASPLVVVVAAVGWYLAWRSPWRRGDRWAAVLAVAVFLLYGAPVIASGEATFAGYIKLDDTSTWLAFTDHVMEYGKSTAGLAPSTYEALIRINFPGNYPIGAFLPLGIGGTLIGQDFAWVFQPYLAWLGALLALCIYWLCANLVPDRRWRVAGAFIAAQGALLVGYSLWGGIKELAAAPLLALAAGLLPLGFGTANRGWEAVRAMVPAAIASAALLGVLGSGAVPWIAPLVVACAAVLAGVRGWNAAARSILAYALAAALPAAPILAGGLVSVHGQTFTSQAELGNLLGPLSPLHVFGIWPAPDFRIDPGHMTATHTLIALAAVAGIAGAAAALKSRSWPLLSYVAGGLLGAVLVLAYTSPWVDAKALAIASPAALTAAVVGALVLMIRWRAIGIALFALIAAGVLWSNVLQYRSVNLAPRDQLAELEEIGQRIQGQGPTLMTEYQTYGARHFLRKADAEGAAELRRRTIPLRDGTILDKAQYANLDEFDDAALGVYRTLVLRRSPAESRPPSPYRRIWTGHYYEAWTRDASPPTPVLEHLPLGNREEAGAEPTCAQVGRLAAKAGPGGMLSAAPVRYTARVRPSEGSYPQIWQVASGDPTRPFALSKGTFRSSLAAPAPGAYEAWLQGSVRAEARLSVDGEAVGSIRHHLSDLFVELGTVNLTRGQHLIDLAYSGPGLQPGSKGGGFPGGEFPIESIVFRRADDDTAPTLIPAEQATKLCGRRWDWIEALSG